MLHIPCIECIELTSGSDRIPIAISVAIFYSLVMLFYQYNCGIERTNCLYVRKRGRMNAFEVAIFCCCASSSCRHFFRFLFSAFVIMVVVDVEFSFHRNSVCARESIDSLNAVCVHDLFRWTMSNRGDVTATNAII